MKNLKIKSRQEKNYSSKPSITFAFGKSSAGFTLIEILVVTSVSALLIAILLVFSRGSGRSIILINEHAKLIQAITTAKSLSVQTFIDVNSSPGSLKPCGYGIHFEGNTYSIFLDTPSPFRTSSPCIDADNKYTGDKKFNTLEVISGRVFTINSAIEIGNLPGGPGVGFDIVFIPPDPKTYFFPPVSEVTITLKLVNGSSEMSVKVNGFGQITSVQ